ncbi:MAG: molybdenum cofactor guanylyltransferase MobA [Pseudomonadota bacterium]
MTPALGVILAGGQARRMGGGDKGRLMLGAHSLIEHVINRLRPQVSRMALNANGDPTRFGDLGLPVLADSIADHPGPLAGVLAGLDWAASQGAASIVTVAADTPFFPRDLVARLEAAGPLALAADGNGRHPTFGHWPVALREDLRDALTSGQRKIVVWTDSHHAGEAMFPGEDAFFNINTPDDLAAAKGRI